MLVIMSLMFKHRNTWTRYNKSIRGIIKSSNKDDFFFINYIRGALLGILSSLIFFSTPSW